MRIRWTLAARGRAGAGRRRRRVRSRVVGAAAGRPHAAPDPYGGASRIAGSEAIAAWNDYRVVGSGRATDTTDYAVWAAAGPWAARSARRRRLDRDLGRDPLPVAGDQRERLGGRWPGPTRGRCASPCERRAARSAPRSRIPSTMVVGQLGVGVDDAGTATVAWSEFVLGAESPVRATTVAPGGAPAPVQTIGEATLASAIVLAVDGSGDAVAGWGTLGSTAQAALRPAGGAFAAPTTFGDPSAAVYVSGAAIAPDGRATLALLRHVAQPLGGGVGLAQGTPGAGWGAPQWLDPSANVRQLTLATDAGGARAAVWDTQPQYYPDRPGVARVALAAPAQPFAVVAEEVEQPPPPPSTDNTQAANDAALTGGGETLVAWSGSAKGVSIHPLSATAGREPIELLVDDACATGGAKIAAGPGAQAAALFLAPRGVWIVYRAAGTAARPRRPRICSLDWTTPTASALRPRVPAGRVRPPRPHLQADRATDGRAAPRLDGRAPAARPAPDRLRPGPPARPRRRAAAVRRALSSHRARGRP